tara:strand:- start:60 stop:701 length:642 start_codon:yes stop_codon:yes gene_type:complete
MKIIIPARKGSKGLPFKNRKLFEYTADTIPISLYDSVYILTDDPEISNIADSYDFNVLSRPRRVSNDSASTKSLIEYALENIELDSKDETIVMLYLTYPERTWSEVEDAIAEFARSGSDSLLCRKEIQTSPFLVLKEEKNGKGSQLFYHDLYRRQDYPKCFEISHYISIFRANSLVDLNSNMYNSNTFFLKIEKEIIDIDTKKDFNKINGKKH